MKKKLVAATTIAVFALFFSQQAEAQWSVTGNAATDTSINFIGTTDNKGVKIKTNNTDRIWIGTNNRVGIGTNSPGYNLEVYQSGAANMSLRSGTASTTMSMDRGLATGNAAFAYKSLGTTLWNSGLIGSDNFTIRNVVTATNVFAITPANLVGIGTTAPTAKFEVAGSATSSPLINIYNDKDATKDSGMIMTASGKVGIGTTAPAERLTVLGDISARSSTAPPGTQWGSLRMGSSNPTFNDQWGGIAVYNTGGADQADLRFYTSYGTRAERMRIDQQGKVGIGTTSPADQLTVQTATNSYGFTHTDGTITVGSYVGGSAGGGWLGTKSNHKLNFFTNNSAAQMTLSTSGDLGIGTTAPSSKLNVWQTANGNLANFDGGAGRGLTVLTTGSSVDVVSYGGSSAPGYSNLNLRAGTSGITVTTSGNVGIGTTTPQEKFHVIGVARFSDNAYILGTTGIGGIYYSNVQLNVTSTLDYGAYIENTFHPGGYTLYVDNTAAKTDGLGFWSLPSDRRLKEKITPYTEGLNQLMKINPVKYFYTEASGMDNKTEKIGVIAQELKEVAPYMVGSFKNRKDGNEYYDVNTSSMLYMMVNAIKELSTQNQAKDLKIAALENQNTAMQKQLNEMQQCVESICNNSPASKTSNSELQTSNSLFQNQPNPFNQSTVISYQLSGDSNNGRIIIRDLNGNLVKQVSIAQSGKGQVTINANTLAQGTYTYTLEIGGVSVDTKLMVVTK